MKTADVSVIIPVYNTEKYLRQCVESVLKQTYPPKEIILVDDGSTDNSPQICDEYKNQYPYIKVIHKDNAGLGMARNTGVVYSECEYVMFLDSDDFLKEDMVEILYIASENMKYDLVKSGFVRTDLLGNPIERRGYSQNIVYTKNEINEELLPRILGSLPNQHDSFEMGVTCALLRRKIIIDNNIMFPSERELISEDLVFNISFMNLVDNTKIVAYCGYMYRTNPDSLTVKFRENRFEASRHLYLYVKKIISDLNIRNNAELRWEKTYFIYLWMSIKQEKGQKYKSSKDRILKVCNDNVTVETINHYPTQFLGIRQRIFTFLVRHKFSFILWGVSQC